MLCFYAAVLRNLPGGILFSSYLKGKSILDYHPAERRFSESSTSATYISIKDLEPSQELRHHWNGKVLSRALEPVWVNTKPRDKQSKLIGLKNIVIYMIVWSGGK